MSTLMNQPVGRSVLVLNDLASGRLHDLNRAARIAPELVKHIASVCEWFKPSPQMHGIIDALVEQCDKIENMKMVNYKQPTVL